MTRTRRQARQDFGAWLDVTLSNSGMRGRELAEKIGVHESAVSRWRGGVGIPSVEILTKIAEELNLEALRLVVTASLIPAEVAGVQPYPMPEPTAQRESIRRQIGRITGVDDEIRQRLLDVYEEANE